MALILADADRHEDEISGIIPELDPSITVPRASLPVDYVFYGKGMDGETIQVGVERKKTQDLVNSLRSGRLINQFNAARGAGIDELCFLWEDVTRKGYGNQIQYLRGSLEHGNWYDTKPAVSVGEVRSQLNTIQRVVGVGLYARTNGAEDSAGQILNWYKWWQTGLDKHKSHHKIWRPQAMDLAALDRGKSPSVALKIFSDLPGWGPEKALAAQEQFRGMKLLGALESTVEEFMEVRGVGKKLAKDAYDALRRPV